MTDMNTWGQAWGQTWVLLNSVTEQKLAEPKQEFSLSLSRMQSAGQWQLGSRWWKLGGSWYMSSTLGRPCRHITMHR